jgi:hypothetical protein
MSEVFPAPDGPNTAINWPDLKVPLTWCKIVFAFAPK